MSNRDWLLIIVYLYAIGVLCQQVYSSLRFNSCFFLNSSNRGFKINPEIRG